MPRIVPRSLGVLVALAALGVSSAQDPIPRSLQFAHEVGAKLEGVPYGGGRNQINCVTFMLRVVEAVTGGTVVPEVRAQLLISDIDTTIENIHDLVEARDDRTKGVAKALVDLRAGRYVEVGDVKPGDFVQYWAKTGERWTMGHAAVVEEVRHRGDAVEVKIYGAHKKTNGVAVHPDWINLSTKRAYLARWEGK